MPVKLKYGNNSAHRHRVFSDTALSVCSASRFSGCSAFWWLARLSLATSTTTTSGSSTTASPPAPSSPASRRSTPRPARFATAKSSPPPPSPADLRQAGYNSNPQLGTFQLNGDNIFIKPGPESYHNTDGATINTSGGVVQSITAENGVALSAYELEPQLITALSEDKNRTKRRLVTYQEIPPHMVQAVVAIEDRDFFEHGGINYLRIAKCAFSGPHHSPQDVRRLDPYPAACAANLFLSPEKAHQAQDPRDPHHLPARSPLQQAADLRDVRQRDQSRPPRQL